MTDDFCASIAGSLSGLITQSLKRWKMKILVQRKSRTDDGIFGTLTVDDPYGFHCFTVERKAKAIPAGVYPVDFTYSPKFNRIMPLILVPGRERVRIHWANFPMQLEGCIAVGKSLESDAVDYSVATFNQLYAIIHGQPGLKIEIKDTY